MPGQNIDSIQKFFQSRLETLEHLLETGQSHFSDESWLQKRIVPDMFPLSTQIIFTCNQPYNFSLWCAGKAVENLDPEVKSLAQAHEHIVNTKKLLSEIEVEDEKLTEDIRLDLGEGLYLDLTGSAYINEFLIPNFYFHLVTAYDILRMAGVQIGKQDYMIHLMPFVRQE